MLSHLGMSRDVYNAAVSQNQTEGHLQQQIVSLEEERLNRETSSKQSLRKVLEEKIQTIQELADVKVRVHSVVRCMHTARCVYII